VHRGSWLLPVVLSAGLAAACNKASSTSPAGVGPDAAMLSPAQQWIDAFNAARTPLPEAVFAEDVVITDTFPPYVWSGKTAAHAWSEALNEGIHSPLLKREHVETAAPRAFLINDAGDRVSFVLPATLTYEEDGKPYVVRAAWQFVLVKGAEGWRITADTWTRTD